MSRVVRLPSLSTFREPIKITSAGAEILVEKMSDEVVGIPYCNMRDRWLYLDVKTGNICMSYRPLQESIVLDNLYSILDAAGCDEPISNIIYWVESYLIDNISWEQFISGLTENPKKQDSLISTMANQYVDKATYVKGVLMNCRLNYEVLMNYSSHLGDLLPERLDISDYGNSPYKEEMLSIRIQKIYSYIRFRGLDYVMEYLMKSDKFPQIFGNRIKLKEYQDSNSIYKVLRVIAAHNELPRLVLSVGDKSHLSDVSRWAIDQHKVLNAFKECMRGGNE